MNLLNYFKFEKIDDSFISGEFINFLSLRATLIGEAISSFNLIALLILSILTFSKMSFAKSEITVGSKAFTESVILGDLVTQLAETTGSSVKYQKALGGTRVLWSSVLRGGIDIYPEYTGTLIQEILAKKKISSDEELKRVLAGMGILMSKPLGFNNTYALGMKEDVAEKLGIRKIADLKKYPDLRFGLTNEFMSRGDGWPSLEKAYQLPQRNVKGLDHDLAYRGLESGSIEVIDLYSTDAEIEYYKLRVLEDDYRHFPNYNAVLVYRSELKEKDPVGLGEILKLQGTISEEDMIKMNALVKLDGVPDSTVASDFLKKRFNIITQPERDNFFKRLMTNTIQHLSLVIISLLAAILVSIPLGILSYKNEKTGKAILAAVGIIQTIPSLALLVFMIPLLGIGSVSAIVALFLYSLLPIVRNTYTGLKDIPLNIKESAEALGLSSFARLRLVELPIASRSILAGIKTSAVINVGTATLGALIGAGGYGQPILTGIRLDNIPLILEGAIPAAVLALLVQWLFDLSELVFVPKGLRLKSE